MVAHHKRGTYRHRSGNAIRTVAAVPTNVVPIRPNNLKAVETHTAYRFKDQDPDVGELTRAITDAGLTVAYIVKKTGLSPSTINNILSGKTRRPQNLTVKFIWEKALEMKVAVLTPAQYKQIFGK